VSDLSRESTSQLSYLLDDEDDGQTGTESLFDDDRERTPIGGTPIVLNPKVNEEPTALCCPDCGEEIAAESFKDGSIVEYRCGCDELHKFKIAGEGR
jgi:hypothetical protein